MAVGEPTDGGTLRPVPHAPEPGSRHGDTLDLKVMVHKIHMGDNLPSGEPYQIIGFGGSVHDYSHVEFPPDIRECEGCHTPSPAATGTENPLVISPNPIPVCDGTGVGSALVSWSAPQAAGVEVRIGSPTGKLFVRAGNSGSAETNKWVKDQTAFFLVDADTKQVFGEATAHTTVLGCVGTPPGTPRGRAGSQHLAWRQRPSRAACGSCHDDVDFVTGQNHTIGLPQPNDDFCGVCHPPQGREFSTAIPGAHTVPYKSTQLEGLLIRIQDIVDTFPGQMPTVFFSITDKNGRVVAPSGLAFFNFNIAGPTDDYSVLIRESARDDAVPVGDGYYSYTFDGSIPNDAEGTFTLGAEGFRTVELQLSSGEVMDFRESAENPVTYFAVTDEAPVPRRQVVADYKCEACHLNLQLHGTIRHNPEYCVTCHIPSGTDVDRRPEDAGPPQSRHFKYMIHKIHRGEELERGFVIYGFGSSRHDYGHLEFPGDLRTCEECHVNDSYELPLPGGLLPTITNWDFFSPTLPIAAACLGCHDSQKAAAHADTMTSAIAGEACATCHGVGADFAVERVHAR